MPAPCIELNAGKLNGFCGANLDAELGGMQLHIGFELDTDGPIHLHLLSLPATLLQDYKG
jgi:hypothetical protein